MNHFLTLIARYYNILEGMENNKRLKRLDGLKYDVNQDVMVTMDFTLSPVYCHLQVTIISDDNWCWDLAWRKLGVWIVDCIPLMDLASVQLGIMSNYFDGLQAVPQVQYLNEFIYVHVLKISDIWISFFSKIDSIITTRHVFLSCCVTLKNDVTLFQPKVMF